MPSVPADDHARRAYWAEQLEAAHAFVQRVLDHPVSECGEPFASLPEAARAAGVEVHFVQAPHVLGLPRLHYLRQGQVGGFLGAAEEMSRRGWVMRVEDGYRTREMQKYLGRAPKVFDAILAKVIWELGGRVPEPAFLLRRSMTLVALMPKIGTHMSGSAIDISVLRRDDGHELDRGGPYLEMSEKTPMDSPFISPEARANRREITAIMNRHGWVEYPWEFWHYNSGDAYAALLRGAAEPARYGAVDWSGPQTNRVTPLADPQAPLNTPDEIAGEIAAALRRLSEAAK